MRSLKNKTKLKNTNVETLLNELFLKQILLIF